MKCHTELHSDSDPRACVSPAAQPGDCTACPCMPVNLLSLFGTNFYIASMCGRLRNADRCKFRKAVLVGFGIGPLPTCIHDLCPETDLVVVDVDPGAAQLAERFFGWRNQSRLVVRDAAAFFKAAQPEVFDLVIVDCFDRIVIPTACNNPSFFADVKRSMKQSQTLFAMNTLEGQWTQQNMTENGVDILRNSQTQRSWLNQWLLLENK
ncbi:unnamed protein product [Polarella glacialis]|uniref:Calmodulin-lysine N-methyltransferase n=1 Tax=Polarella glacialis TaxID=89957 RepID=A0A813HYP3_POLGL|nr:unnamed protein product [Polarella glacialis]